MPCSRDSSSAATEASASGSMLGLCCEEVLDFLADEPDVIARERFIGGTARMRVHRCSVTENWPQRTPKECARLQMDRRDVVHDHLHAPRCLLV
jgi:hypothetical protein